MTEIRGRTFGEGENVEVDGIAFVDCKFEGTTMRYAGGDHPSFDNCQARDVTWYFADGALRTVQLLQQIYNNGGRELISDLFRPGHYIGE